MMNTIFTRKAQIFFFLFSFLFNQAFAHNGSLKGGVYEEQSLKPLEGVNIVVKELNQNAVTDVFGTFFLSNLAPGDYTLQVYHIGYETFSTVINIKDGLTTTFSANLQKSPIRMSEVVINSKKEQNLSTISGLDLKLRPTNTAQDMLKLVPGLFIAQHAGGGKAEQMFLRGFDIDHGTDINISVDGMPVNMVSHAHGQGYSDLHFLIPELVEKVNFAKGPYQADKGNFATAGYVDFRTANFLDQSFIKMEGGNYGYFRTVGALDLLGKNNVNNISGAYIAGEYSNNRGYFDAPQNFNRFNLTGKYTTILSKNRLLSLSLSAFRSNWDASGQIPERAVAEGIIGRFGEVAKGEGGNTSRYNLNAQFSQSISDHQLFKSNFYLSYYDFELYSNFTFFLNDSINGDQIRQKEKRILYGYNASYLSDYSLGNVKAKTEAGAGFRYDNSMDNELSRTKDRVNTLSRLSLGDINETNVFGYVSQTFYPLPKLSLNAALRYDYFIHDYYDKLDPVYNRQSFNTGAFSPKVNMYYSFSENARVFANYGIGFHSNDTRVVVARRGQNVLPLAFSYDVGTILKPLKKMILSTSLWMLDLQDEFVYVGDEAVIESGGRTRRMGIDISLRYELLKWLYLDADYNYTRGRLRDANTNENYIPLAPISTAIGGLTVKHNSLSSSLRFRYIGDRPANEDYTVTAHGYTLFDATINYTRPKYEFGVQIQNIFNVEWNEAQFDTETRLSNEAGPTSEIHFTPGTPFFIKFTAAYRF